MKTENPAAPAIAEIALDAIEPHPANARTFPADDSEHPGLVELAASIKAVGLLEPIVVRHWRESVHKGAANHYQILAGERRWRAMRLVKGATTIAAVVRDVGDREALEILVTENLQREDLSPLEEALGVRALVDQAGWTLADVADRLGRPLHWVAQRARLMSLSPAWQAKIADPKCGISRWPASLLVLVARLEPHVQDGILDHWRHDSSPPARRDLERELADLTRELRKAPWKVDDAALYPKAGPCAACHKRSACNPGLFEDEDPQKPEKTDRCLDASCWHEKAQRHLAVREAELREKFKDVVLVNGGDANYGEERREGARSSWEVQEVKKTAPGAVPALIVSGRSAGTVRWVAPPRADSTSRRSRQRGADGKPAPSTLAHRRASLERRRKAKAVETIRGLVETSPTPATTLLIQLAAVFGTSNRRDGFYFDGYDDVDDKGVRVRSENVWKLLARLDAKSTDGASSRDLLWQHVRKVLGHRLQYMGSGQDFKRLWAEVDQVSEVLGLDAAAALRQAVEAIPEPKAWARLKPDGTAKRAAPRKGKAKGARKPKVGDELEGKAAS